MSKSSFRKLISAMSALVMSASLLVPAVSADYINEDQSSIIIDEEQLFEEQILEASNTNYQSTTVSFPTSKTGNFTVDFDYTINKTNNAAIANRDSIDFSTNIKFAGTGTSGGITAGPVGDDGTMQFYYMNSGISNAFKLALGKEYNMRFIWQNAGLGASYNSADPSTAVKCTLVVTDKETGAIVSNAEVNMRNLTDTSNSGSKNPITGIVIGYCADKKYSEPQPAVTLRNMCVYASGVNRFDVRLDGKEMTMAEPTVLDYDYSKEEFSLISKPYDGTSDASGVLNTVVTLEGLGKSQQNYIKYDSDTQLLTVTDDIPTGTYNFEVETYIRGYRNVTMQRYPVTVNVGEANPSAIAQNYADGIKLTYEDGTAVSGKIWDDVVLDAGTKSIDVAWQCMEQNADGEWVSSSVIDSDGVIKLLETVPENLKLTATVSYKGDAENAVVKDIPVSVMTAKEMADKIAGEMPLYLNSVNATTKEHEEAEIKNGAYSVTETLYLPKTYGRASVNWSFAKKDASGNAVSGDETVIVVDEMGVITAEPEEGCTYELTADITCGAEKTEKVYALDLSEASGLFNIDLINANTQKVENADNTEETFDLTSGETLKHDIILPTTYKTNSSIAIKWESGDEDYLKQYNDTDTWRIYTDDTSNHAVTLKKTIQYLVNKEPVIEKEFDYTVNIAFTKEDIENTDEALDKYKVRFDSVCASNFEDIDGETYTEDFELPDEGYFGSDIEWTSKDVSVIKISGSKAKVTRPSSTKTVALEAVFTRGDITGDEKAEVSVKVTGKGSTSGGSSGGSSSRSSSGGGNAYSGGISSATGMIGGTTPADNTTSAPPASQVSEGFTDIADVEWAAPAINHMAKKGIVNGKTATTFAPNDNITRAEFAKILYGAFDLGNAAAGSAEAAFSDVNAGDWYYDYVMTCAKDGIITGYDNGAFGANDLVTRQDMAVMVMRAVKHTGKTVEAANVAVSFDDAEDIADYAKEAVSALQQGGIINGMTETTFAPANNATRAQAVKILYSFCNE